MSELDVSSTSLSASESARLLDWYAEHHRDLPWRRTRDPYAIWVSEIMCQQTQVATVIPYYERWMARFPTAEALADADESEALALWQGLGYYRRCRQLLEGVRHVRKGGLPTRADDWIRLPGIGRYTAAAIASICADEPAAVVDGNVERVFARFTGCDRSGSALTAAAREWAQASIVADHPGQWNQAVMELGARVCMPRQALCSSCPFATNCVARQNDLVATLPRPAPKPEPIHIEQAIVVPQWQDRFGIRQVPSGRWWQGMWEFWRFETTIADEVEAQVGTALARVGSLTYTVTRHRVTAEVFHAQFETAPQEFEWVASPDLASYPMPAPMRRALHMARDRTYGFQFA